MAAPLPRVRGGQAADSSTYSSTVDRLNREAPEEAFVHKLKRFVEEGTASAAAELQRKFVVVGKEESRCGAMDRGRESRRRGYSVPTR